MTEQEIIKQIRDNVEKMINEEEKRSWTADTAPPNEFQGLINFLI